MVSPYYDISEFADFVNSKDNVFELLEIAENELYQAEISILPGSRGISGKTRSLCGEYIRELNGFIYFLRFGRWPSGMRSFDLFRTVCQNLIDKKLF